SGYDHVTGQRHVDAGTHGDAVDRCDGGDPKVGNTKERSVCPLEISADLRWWTVRVAEEAGHVGASAKRGSLATDYQRTRIRIRIHGRHRLAQLLQHQNVERVAARRVIQDKVPDHPVTL